ncbi:MFS transporter [Candidatus Woesearchaeota archaeon]|jgi:MFS family permease|nr:MFS transporter [Candidatus Woesearchaeota archaeon]
MNNNYKSNLWKFFIFALSQRRNFIPILSIFFLTLPNTTAKQIGLYTGIGYLTSFLFEIPSGYFSDVFGHKRSLIFSKIAMICSQLFFIFASSVYWFIAGSILMATSLSLSSGTKEAFMHDTLKKLKREKEFSKVMGKLSANISVVSVVLIVLLPFFTSINILVPLWIWLFVDFIGLFISFTFVNTNNHKTIQKKDQKSVLQLFKDAHKFKFFSIAIFTGAITGFHLGSSGFRSVYLDQLGYPIIFLGFVMGLSRLIWFVVGNYAHLIEEKFTMKQHFLFEIFFFPLLFFAIAFFSNPYFVGLLFSIIVGYQWGRHQVINNYLLNYNPNPKYKATIISFMKQISAMFQFSMAFIGGFVMNYSYKLGYAFLGIVLFLFLVCSYYYIKKH